jgi:hypothetical protein
LSISGVKRGIYHARETQGKKLRLPIAGQPHSYWVKFVILIFASAISAVGISLLLASLTAVWATHWFVLQTLFLIKSLFAFGEDEFFAAIFAN